jgi:hypothetical protein
MAGDVRGTAVRTLGFTESAYKTPGANGNLLYLVQNTVVPSRAREQSQTLAGRRGRTRSVDGNKDVAGGLTMEIAPESLGWALKHAIGAPTTTGAGPYVHVFQTATSGANAMPPGFTLEEDYTSNMSGSARYLRKNGMRVADWSLTIGPAGFLRMVLNAMGATWEQAATSLDGTPTDTGHNPFSAAEVVASIGGGPLNICVAQFTINGGNDLDPDKRCVGAGGERDGMPEGFFDLGGNMVMFLDHEDVINTVLSGADTSLTIEVTRGLGDGTAGNEKLTIEIPDIVFDITGPTVEGPRGLRVNANFTSHRIGTAENAATFTLENAVATID